MAKRLKYLLFGMIALLLSSCSTHLKRHDGPPNFYVDETKIPNAVPKPEPLAKYGNYNSYVVFGKRYYTLKSSRHYDAIGTASWYGTQFHAMRTSSGERYNMLAMTAAHKTLPLPTYVEVTNLKNNRKIIVKVNDRGPFEANRLIDLSYVAAKKLGMIGHGTTRVRVRAIDPDFRDDSTELATTNIIHHDYIPNSHLAGPQIYFQVGAFRNQLRAEHFRQHLETALNAPVIIASPSDHSSLYKVKVGPIVDRRMANQISLRLKSLGIKRLI